MLTVFFFTHIMLMKITVMNLSVTAWQKFFFP